MVPLFLKIRCVSSLPGASLLLLFAMRGNSAASKIGVGLPCFRCRGQPVFRLALFLFVVRAAA